jgi:hypothetical protein
MVDTPEITRTVAQPAAVIRLTVARAGIQNVIGPPIEEVIATVTLDPVLACSVTAPLMWGRASALQIGVRSSRPEGLPT